MNSELGIHCAQLAHEAFLQEDYATTINLAMVALEHDPDNGRLYEILGISCWMRNQLPEALTALETASAFVPLKSLSQLALASAYAAANMVDLAKTVYHHLVTWPDFPIPLLPKLAAGLGRIGQYESALIVCQKIVELRPEYHAAWFGIAFYQRRLGRSLNTVITAMKKAVEHAPNVLHYRLNLTGLYAEAGQFANAYRAAEDIALEQVQCGHWLRLMIPVFDWAGDWERADAATQRLEEQPHRRNSCPEDDE